ncbi:hypothetical protein PLESTB_001517700 [Pleodorina starrii]|uniref:FHA domain-containing protein n=1 Tax=Pleodorina starrii TaxID=330485 RepID=A0A9W6BXH7_9CHLO|nr:hypothetical protein PLESTM_000984000 [Pleodorina starrii]GLC59647.1 hypothetical protein PLESTB_001517700 [Pleodorina starrii]GLC74616.1 hypothetical protein PLESTF_001535400 [Pleodorina starrii]
MEQTGANAAGPSSSGHSISPNDPRLVRCGFAKLQGDGIEFFVRKYEITIGRTSKNSTLDLILGDSTTISRQHATIRYNFDAKCFELVVLGKNGVQVESCGSGATHLYTPDSPPTPLRSRDLLIMGEKRFYFLLPRAMGGQSRKRRRMEPSPAPGASTVPAGAAPAAAAPAPAPPAAGAQQHPPQPQPAPVAAAPFTATGPVGGVPVSGPEHQPQPQAVAQPQPQQQQPQPVFTHTQAHVAGSGPAAELAVTQHPYQMQHEDEDALINSSAMSYDNGTSYGYGDQDSGFPGAF